MRVKILKSFSDKENKCIQHEGSEIEITEERAEQIMSAHPELIKVLEESALEFPKHVGGGLYVLSNGEKIKGKAAALEAEEKLKSKE
jgi:hypothetical protein